MTKSQQNQESNANTEEVQISLHRTDVKESLESIDRRKRIEKNMKQAFINGVREHLAVLSETDVQNISFSDEGKSSGLQFTVVMPCSLYQVIESRSAAFESTVESTVNRLMKKGNKAIKKQKKQVAGEKYLARLQAKRQARCEAREAAAKKK